MEATMQNTTRRNFLRLAGGGSVAAITLPLTGCDAMPAEAVAAWNGPASSETDPRRRALAWALLAPNPHNMQPWLADLRQPGRIDLYIDRTRLLPETDPFGRQIVIGHGCFIELLVLAAADEGWEVAVEYFPAGPVSETVLPDQADRPLAQLVFRKAAEKRPDTLFAQATRRRSNKETYEAKPLLPEHARALAASHAGPGTRLILHTDAAMVAQLKGITQQAGRIEIETPRTLLESVERTRIGAAAIRAQPDGIDLHGPLFWWLRQLGMMTPEKAMTPGSMAWQGGMDYMMKGPASAAAFGLLVTPGNSRRDQIEAGRAYLRLNLKATELGVAMHPLSQVLQEYAEMAALQAEFLKQQGIVPGQRVQMLFRLGYAALPEPAPRRRLEALLMT